ncbi:MAG: cyclic nucleotide-binding domain-containing protein [Nitrospirae bacterium]|nr:cyclic nucleotide-binding domain-containing protein [Magnetococcales bacterium]
MSGSPISMEPLADERNFSCAFGFMLLCLLVCLLQIALLWGMFWEYGLDPLKTPVHLIGWHSVLALMLFFWAWYRGRNISSPCLNGFYYLLPLATGMMGFVGIIGVMLAFGLFWEYRKTATSFDEWYESLFPADFIHASTELMLRIEGQGAHAALTPFMDILAYGTQEQKQTMIAKMSRHFKPAFAPVLREAVNNADNAVRVQAATAISHVENSFMRRTMALEQQREHHPDDMELVLTVARHYDDFAFTGLLDPVREGENRQKAIAGYRACLAGRPGDHGLAIALGRTLVRSGELVEAAEFFEATLRHGEATHQMVLWAMETLFKLKRFDQLEVLSQRYQKLFLGEDDWMLRIRDTVDLWSGWYNGDGLHNVPIFRFFSVSERTSLVKGGKILEYKEGETIVHQGDTGDSLYLIVSGMVVVTLDAADQGPLEVARLGEGNYFGEMSLLTGARRNANCLALTEKCRLMEISIQDFLPIIRGKPDILSALATDIAQRQLKAAAKTKAQFLEIDPRNLAQLAESIHAQIQTHLAAL